MPADRAFGPLKRTFHVPPGWIVFASSTQGEGTLHESDSMVHAGDITDLLLIKAGPVQVEIVEGDVASADGFACTAVVRLWVRVAQDPGDLKSFRQTVLGSRETADSHTLRRYLSLHARRALAQFAAQHPAANLVDGADREAIGALIEERVRPALFAGGLLLDQPAQVSFDSDRFREQRNEQEERAAREHVTAALAAARACHLSQLEELFGQLQALAERSPGTALPELIRTFPDGPRARIYEALWRLTPPREQTQWIVVVAGHDVLCFDPALPDAPARQTTIDGPAGPLRSVRVHRRADGDVVLLVGAARGVYEVGANDLKVQAGYLFIPP